MDRRRRGGTGGTDRAELFAAMSSAVGAAYDAERTALAELRPAAGG